jgi:hypothetical protein
MGSFVGIAASVTGTSRGVGVTCELFVGGVPVVRCSWRDLRESRLTGAVR